jgi:hypothetical protein
MHGSNARRIRTEVVFAIGVALTAVGFVASSVTISHALITVGAGFMTAGVVLWVYATRVD